MPKPIAFVSRSDEVYRDNWLKVLSTTMTNEKIIDFGKIAPADYPDIELAIVANPDPQELKKLTGLKWIQSLWAGVDQMVKELPEDAPPIVRLIDPYLTKAMAEAVLAFSTYLARDMPIYQEQQQKKLWQQHFLRPLCEWTIGVLGLGELGKASATLLKKVGFQVTGWSRTQKNIPDIHCVNGVAGFSEIIETSDIVVLLLPLTTKTRGLLGKEQFDLMKKGASLINFARGPIVDTTALIEALESRHLNHAVLDVFDKEPLPQTSPLWQNKHITVLPHIAAPTTMETAAKIVADNIVEWRKTGKLPQTVNRYLGY